MSETLDSDIVTAIAALSPTASLRLIQDHIASRGLPTPSQPELLDALERLERAGMIERKVETEEGNHFAKRHVYYHTIEGAEVPWATPQVRLHKVQNG